MSECCAGRATKSVLASWHAWLLFGLEVKLATCAASRRGRGSDVGQNAHSRRGVAVHRVAEWPRLSNGGGQSSGRGLKAEDRVLATAKFGFSMAAVGVAAAIKKAFGGYEVSPRKGGARFFVTCGMSREATQELSGWKPPEDMERIHSKVRSEEAARGVRAGVARASDREEMEDFLKELEFDLTFVGEGRIGLPRSSYARRWFGRFSGFVALFTP